MWWNDYYWHGPWMFFGPVMMVVFLAACAAIMFLMMRGHGTRRGSAAEILKQRYARGEIDDEEYEKRRRVLDS
jgi:putative membrane protein